MKEIAITMATLFMLLGIKRDENPQEELPLYGTKWILEKVQSDTGTLTVTEKKAFIKFNKEKKSAGGNGSCNSFGSALKVNGAKMTISNIFSTKMFCEGVYETEKAFFQQLRKVTRYEIKGNSLLLYGNTELILELKAE